MQYNTILSIGGFTMANKVLTKQLGPIASILYGEIYSLALYWSKNGKLDKDGFFYLTYSDIFEQTGIKEKTARKHLKKLEEIGLIESMKKKGHPCRFYRVTHLIQDYLESAIIKETEEELVPEENTYTLPLLSVVQEKKSDSISTSGVNTPDFFADDYQQNIPSNNNNNINTNLYNITDYNNTLEVERESYKNTNLDSEVIEYILLCKEKFISKGIPIDTIINVFSEKKHIYKPDQQVIVLKHLLSYGSPIHTPASFIAGAFDKIPELTERYQIEMNRIKNNALNEDYVQQGKMKPKFYNWLIERD